LSLRSLVIKNPALLSLFLFLFSVQTKRSFIFPFPSSRQAQAQTPSTHGPRARTLRPRYNVLLPSLPNNRRFLCLHRRAGLSPAKHIPFFISFLLLTINRSVLVFTASARHINTIARLVKLQANAASFPPLYRVLFPLLLSV